MYNVGDISSLYVHNDCEFSFTTVENEERYYLNIEDNLCYQYDIKEFFDIFDFSALDEIAMYSLPTETQSDPNISRIYSQYPNGSYFTTTGTTCVNHNHCKSYNGAIQCYGIAKYAYNVYANQSKWETIPAERFDDDTTFTDSGSIQRYFEQCAPLTIVFINGNSSSKYEYHAITVVTLTNNYIQVYDCNWTGDCKVRLINMTYDAFKSIAPSSSYFSTHKYSTNYAYNNELTHKQYCDNSGCNGYRLEYHYNPVYGASFCWACGATVTTQYIEPLTTSLVNSD